MSFQMTDARPISCRLDRIAGKIKIEHRRIYYLAGYQIPLKCNDAPALLRRMHVTLGTGDLAAALQTVFRALLNVKATGRKL